MSIIVKNNKPDVSIVVTVHNAEKYLKECLYSVCNQSYKNIEIICVDGGSTDFSSDILEEFERKDKRIKIISDKNTSYGHKLNIGFEAALGKYVGILESDDKLCINMINSLYPIANQYNADVVGGNVQRSFDYRGEWVGYEVQTYKNEFYHRLILKDKEPIVYAHGAIFASLYKKAFLMENKIKLNETPGASFQDQGFSFLTDILAKTAYYIKKPVYEYRIDNAGSSVYDDKKIYEITWEMKFIEQELKKRNVSDCTIWEEFWKTKYLHYIDRMRFFSQDGRRKFKNVFLSELKNDIEKGILEGNIFCEQQKKILQKFLTEEMFEKNIAVDSKMKVNTIFKVLDQIINRSVVIFGAGYQGKYFYHILKDITNKMKTNYIDIKCFCDNNLEVIENSIEDKEVLSVELAVKKFTEAVFVITSEKYHQEMIQQLKGYDVKQENICFYI